LPERPWHAVLIDSALDTEAVERLGEAARRHATQRIVMFTPATRHEIKPSSAFTGYLVKPLRVASLAARLSLAPEVARPRSRRRCFDRGGRADRDAGPRIGQGTFGSGRRRQRDQRAVDALA